MEEMWHFDSTFYFCTTGDFLIKVVYSEFDSDSSIEEAN